MAKTPFRTADVAGRSTGVEPAVRATPRMPLSRTGSSRSQSQLRRRTGRTVRYARGDVVVVGARAGFGRAVPSGRPGRPSAVRAYGAWFPGTPVVDADPFGVVTLVPGPPPSSSTVDS